jgi:hypothetical protein
VESTWTAAFSFERQRPENTGSLRAAEARSSVSGKVRPIFELAAEI